MKLMVEIDRRGCMLHKHELHLLRVQQYRRTMLGSFRFSIIVPIGYQHQYTGSCDSQIWTPGEVPTNLKSQRNYIS